MLLKRHQQGSHKTAQTADAGLVIGFSSLGGILGILFCFFVVALIPHRKVLSDAHCLIGLHTQHQKKKKKNNGD